MRHAFKSIGIAIAVVSAFGGTAMAQERTESYFTQYVPAPSNALELKVGTGYTQGFGNIAPDRRISDIAGAGIGASAEVDYRLSPLWSLGVEGQYQEFSNQQNASARGLAANVGATYHFMPTMRGDPWARLGTGYRFLWENDPQVTYAKAPGATVLRHGFDLVTAKVGYDIRVTDDFAIAPVVGADLNLFVWEDSSGNATQGGADHALTSSQVGTFVYAGLQGRFDIGGKPPPAVAKAPEAPQPTGVTAPQPQTPIAPQAPVETKPASPSLAVSEDIIRECKLNLDSITKSPKFEFDKSDLLPQDLVILDQIGACFTTGPLAGESLHLVGRADPRGSVAYNQALGMRRATSVENYLERVGMDGSHITKTSRGKLDARGTDEASWAIDRRVDVLLITR